MEEIIVTFCKMCLYGVIAFLSIVLVYELYRLGTMFQMMENYLISICG
mgnify:CR=1 FL=1|jgi:hypothetical protein